MDKIVLIDGHSMINRAFYAIPDLTNASGKHTNAVYGFLNILFKILEEEQPQYLSVAFDVHAPTFRHERYADYKGTRKAMPQELREQVPLLQKVLRAMGICLIMLEGYEADDLLGTVGRRSADRGMAVTIVSGDRDLLQLATDVVKIRIPRTRGGKTTIEDFYAQDVLESYQLMPPQIVDLKGLMGDSSDNIPGIPGVGEKTATKLLMSYGTVENAYAHLEEIKPNKARESLRDHYDMALLSKELAQINTDSPLEFDWERARMGELYTPEAYEWFKELNFKNMLSRFDKQSLGRSAAEEGFSTVADLAQAETLFMEAASCEWIGVQVMKQKDELLGLALALAPERTVFLPVQGFLGETYLRDKLTQLLNSGVHTAVMDVKELLGMAKPAKQEHVFDVGVAAYLNDPLRASYSYEEIAELFLSETFPGRKELIGRQSLAEAAAKEPELLQRLACYMGHTAFCVRQPLWQRLQEQQMDRLYLEIELPLAFVLYEMEQEGIRVAKDELAVYGDRLAVRVAELEQVIYEQAGEQFNINSPKQLGVILFEKLQLPGGRKTKTGYSTAADVLEKLANDHGIVNDILEYRQLTKLKSTYADGLAGYIGEDGRIHSSFNQTITATGRISSTEPNLQNIPIRMELGRMIRKVFIPKEGCIFLDADYSQIELRVLAHCSGDEALIAAYRQAEDIHRLTASQVFHTPFEEVTDLQRRNAKAVNFGIVYGISSFGLSQDLSITRKEAADYIERYFETYPKIKEYLDRLVREAREKGYAVTLFGRRRPVPELSSGNFAQRSFGERVAMNSPIQGTAADIIKIAMIRVSRSLKERGLRSRLILQVHDELLIETYLEETEAVSEILSREMQRAASLAVPLEVDMHQGENWYEAK